MCLPFLFGCGEQPAGQLPPGSRPDAGGAADSPDTSPESDETSDPAAAQDDTEPILATVHATQTTEQGYALMIRMTIYAPGPTERFMTWMGSSASRVLGACMDDRFYFEQQGVQLLSAQVEVEDASPSGYEWPRGADQVTISGPGLDKGWVGTWSTGSSFVLGGCGSSDPNIVDPGDGDLLWYREQVYSPNKPDGDLAALSVGLGWLNPDSQCTIELGQGASQFSGVEAQGDPFPRDGFCGITVPAQDL